MLTKAGLSDLAGKVTRAAAVGTSPCACRAGRGVVIDRNRKLIGDAHLGLGQTKQHSKARWEAMA
jgi:hypothetical protein